MIAKFCQPWGCRCARAVATGPLVGPPPWRWRWRWRLRWREWGAGWVWEWEVGVAPRFRLSSPSLCGRLIKPSSPPGAFRIRWVRVFPPSVLFFQGSPHLGDVVSGPQLKFCQGFPPMGEFSPLGCQSMGVTALGRPTSWWMYLSAATRICGPQIKFGQVLPPLEEFVSVESVL